MNEFLIPSLSKFKLRHFTISGFILLSAACYLLSTTSTAHASVIKPSNNLGLRAYYSMEDGVGAYATDFSGRGNTGTLTNGPTWATGKIGQAIKLDGTDDWVNITDNSAQNFGTGDFTLSTWVKTTGAQSDTLGMLIAKAWTNSDPMYYVAIRESDGALDFRVTGTAGAGITDTIRGSGFNDGNWHFMTLVIDRSGNTVKAYKDAVQQGADVDISSVSGGVNPSGPLRLGVNEVNGYPLKGLLDEVRLYSRALSATEIANLYAQTSIGKVKNSAQGLVGLWQFDEMSGTTVTDKTGRGSNGTLLPVPTSISRVQYNHTYPGTSGASLAFSSTVTSGNLIIVATSGSGGSISTVGDNCSNTYHQAVTGAVGITVSDIWYAYNVNGGTCTVTVTSTMSDFGMSIFEYAGTSAGDPLLTTHTDLQKKAGTAFSTTADGMVFVHWANESAGADATGYGSGWSGIQHDTSHYDLQEENITAVAGSYTPSVGGADQGSDVLLAAAFRGLNRPIWTTGKYGGSVKFDGIDDLVGVGDKSDLRIESRPFTLAAWVNVAVQPSTGQGAIIIAKGNGGSGGYGLQYVNSGGTYQLSLTKYGVVDQLINQTLSLNTWYHIAAVQTATQVEYFINGASIGTYSNSSSYASSSGFNFNIGIMSNNSANPWNGLIDDVRVYNRALSAREIANIYNSSGEGYAIVNASMNNLLTNGLVGLWSFNGPDMTNATSTDRSGQGNDGTLVGGPKKVIGINGQALSFDGVDDYVDTGNGSAVNPTTAISVCAWINSTNPTVSSMIINKDNSGSFQYTLRMNGTTGKVMFRATNSGLTSAEADGNTVLSANTWYSSCGTYDGSNVRIFVNGVEDGTAGALTGTMPNNGSNLTIGRRDDGFYFPGKIDDVRIYNRSLSQNEIQQLYGIGR